MKNIVIIGCGYTGFICAYELLSVLGAESKVTLFDNSNSHGRGYAYSTIDNSHVLNVPAHKMSAYHNEPNHFAEWLKLNYADLVANLDINKYFAPRNIYGHYLQEQLQSLQQQDKRLNIVSAEVVALQKQVTNNYQLMDDSSQKYEFDAVILANGNAPNKNIFTLDSERLIINPWQYEQLNQLQKAKRVVIVGGGLTMVDLLLSLHEHDFSGNVISYSLLGEMPIAHANSPQAYPEFVSDFITNKASFTLSALYARTKTHLKQHKNDPLVQQSIIDSLRPYSQELWKLMTCREQKRFLRYIRPRWDIIRHRIAPEIMQEIQQFINSDRLTLRQGRFQNVVTNVDDALVAHFQRLDGSIESVECDYLVNGTGISANVLDVGVLITQMLGDGLIQLDANGLGLHMVDDYRVSHGETIYASGPLTRAKLWENIAIPDIRKHANNLVKEIVQDLR